MKQIKFERDWKHYIKRAKKSVFDDGALVSISFSKDYHVNNEEKRFRHGIILFHKNLIKQFNSSAEGVELLFNGNFLGFRFVNEYQTEEVYKLRKISRNKYMIGCGLATRCEKRKYFEKDVFLDAKNNIPVIKVIFEKGKELTKYDLGETK